jgi:ubiquinone/menaquinone biosynthesis C-methylase UbiE
MWMAFLIRVFQGALTLLLTLILLLNILRVVKRFYHVPAPALATRLLDNPLRRRFVQPPGEVANRMRVEPGMDVVEIGPGKGSYTIEVARRVQPGGKVYVIDIQEAVVDNLQERAEREEVDNLHPMVEDAYAMPFEDSTFDRVLMNADLAEIPEPVRVLRECHRILKPDGLVCLCEMLPDPDYPLRRTEKRWAEESGLELREEFGNFIYQLNFGKKSDPF